jgi:hypothetical protein
MKNSSNSSVSNKSQNLSQLPEQTIAAIIPIVLDILYQLNVISTPVDSIVVQSKVSQILTQKPRMSTSVNLPRRCNPSYIPSTQKVQSEKPVSKYVEAIADNIEGKEPMEIITDNAVLSESQNEECSMDEDLESRKRCRDPVIVPKTMKAHKSNKGKDVSKLKKSPPPGLKFEEALIRYQANCERFREIIEEERRKFGMNESKDLNDEITAANLLPKWVNALVANVDFSVADFGCSKCDAKFSCDQNRRKESLRRHLLDTCHFLDDIRNIAKTQRKVRSSSSSRHKLDSHQ